MVMSFLKCYILQQPGEILTNEIICLRSPLASQGRVENVEEDEKD